VSKVDEIAARTQRRVRRLDDRTLLGWLEAALSGMCRHLDEYRKTDEVAHLGEIMIADTSVAVVLAELEIRHQARKQEGLA
jgi:hypothetical protein